MCSPKQTRLGQTNAPKTLAPKTLRPQTHMPLTQEPLSSEHIFHDAIEEDAGVLAPKEFAARGPVQKVRQSASTRKLRPPPASSSLTASFDHRKKKPNIEEEQSAASLLPRHPGYTPMPLEELMPLTYGKKAAQKKAKPNSYTYSETEVPLEALKPLQLTAQERELKKKRSQKNYAEIAGIAQDETLQSITPSRSLKDDKAQEQLWLELNERVGKIVVPTIVLGVDTASESVRQSAVILEDTIINVIKARNLFMLKKTLDGNLIVLPKPQVAKNPVARFLGSLATMGIPGAAGARALKGVKAIQKMKENGGLAAKNANRIERAVGSFLTTNEQDSLLNHAFRNYPDIKNDIDRYFEGKESLKSVSDKLWKTAEDGVPRKSVRIMIRAIKQMKENRESEVHK